MPIINLGITERVNGGRKASEENILLNLVEYLSTMQGNINAPFY